MNEKNSRTDLMDRIWKIRDHIQELEDIKEEIINYLIPTNNIENNANNIWITDAKEFYYNTVAAWEMLSASTEGKEKF